MGTPPTFDPDQRAPEQVAPPETYHRGDPVWVYRGGNWHPGLIDGSSPMAVIVTYQPVGTRGTMVDTVSPECLVHRKDAPTERGQ